MAMRLQPDSTAAMELQHLPGNTHSQAHSLAQVPSLNEANFLELNPSAVQSFPEGGLRAWSVVLGSFAIICPTFGLAASAGILQSYWESNQLSSYSSSSIGWIIAVNLFLTLGLGIQVGPVFDRYGPRYILLGGGIGYVAGLVLLAQSSLYWHFMLVFGVMMGICSALLTTTAISVVAHWFQVKRGRASGVAIMGSSLGGMVFPLMLKPMFDRLGWMWSMRVFALVVAGMMVLGNICIRGRLTRRTGIGKGGAIDLRCFRDSRFVWATVGLAGAEFCLFGALALLPTYALSQGFSTQTSFNIIAVLNAGSAVGRFSAGHISDTFGRFNSMMLFISFSVLTVFGLWIPISTPYYDSTSLIEPDVGSKNTSLLYAFSVLFGFGSGSIISLAPVCFGQLCGVEQYGQYYGTTYSVVSFATLICVPIGGALLPAAGPQGFAAFFGGILGFSLVGFGMARWACLDYHWKWKAVI